MESIASAVQLDRVESPLGVAQQCCAEQSDFPACAGFDSEVKDVLWGVGELMRLSTTILHSLLDSKDLESERHWLKCLLHLNTCAADLSAYVERS